MVGTIGRSRRQHVTTTTAPHAPLTASNGMDELPHTQPPFTWPEPTPENNHIVSSPAAFGSKYLAWIGIFTFLSPNSSPSLGLREKNRPVGARWRCERGAEGCTGRSMSMTSG